MNRNPRLLLLVCLLAGAGVIFLVLAGRPGSRGVGDLLDGKVPAVAAYSNIALEGEAAYRELASILTAQESEFDRQYEKWRGRVPQPLRDQLPPRSSKDEIRRALGRSVVLLGPVGSRAIVPAVEQAVEYSDPITSLSLVRTLEWSIPDSPRSIKILSNYLARAHPDKLLLGMSTGHEIYAHLPQLAPLMQPWLRFSDQAGEAAEALGAMGAAAAFAVPDLVQVSEFGVAGDPPKFQLRFTYPPGEDIQSHNRGQALIALGRIGLASQAVLDAFAKALPETNRLFRCHTADGLAELGPKALPLLPLLLANLATNDQFVLRFQIEAIGKMGPGAAPAVPTLLKYCDPQVARGIPVEPDPERLIRPNSEPMHLPYAAAFALAQVDLEKARGHGETLARSLSYPRLSPEAIQSLRPLAPDLLPHAKTLLEQKDPSGFFRAAIAGNFLLLHPSFAPAKATLEQAMAGKDRASCYAALRYLQAMGDTNKAMAIFRNALNSDRDQIMAAASELRTIGPAAKPLAPDLQRLLNHPDFAIRATAGRALLAIAPEALPPVN
jgi:tetratricopeptide (TPR) repeat protein